MAFMRETAEGEQKDYDRYWKGPRTLFECLELLEEIKPYVNGYRMNLYEIAYLSEEQVQMFTSDFKIAADYFVQMRKRRWGIRYIEISCSWKFLGINNEFKILSKQKEVFI